MFSSSDKKSISMPTEAQPDWVMNNRDVIGLISRREYLPELQDACHWAQTSRFFYHATDKILTTRKHAYLTDHILVQPNLDNLKKVIAVMANDPLSLEYKIKYAYDNVGRVYENKTLFQLACAAGDIEFCKELKSIFIKHLGGELDATEAMKRQRDEMIGDRDIFDAEQDKYIAQIKLRLEAVIKVISSQNFNENERGMIRLRPTTLEVIGNYRQELKNILMMPDIGAYNTYIIMLEVFKIYSKVSNEWNYDIFKCFLFEDAVLAPIMSYLPANDQYNFSTGLADYESGITFEKTLSTMRHTTRKLTEACNGPSTNFAMNGAYFDIIVGRLAEVTEATPLNEKIPEMCNLVHDYFGYKMDEFDELLSVPNSEVAHAIASLGGV